MNRLWTCILPVLAAGAVAAGCGSEQTDVSQGIDDINEQLAAEGVKAEVDCPDKVDGGADASFDCTMRSDDGKTTAPLKMKIVEQDDELAVTWADDAEYQRAVGKVAKAQQ